MRGAIWGLAQSLFVERLQLPPETRVAEIRLDPVGNVQMLLEHPTLPDIPEERPWPHVVPLLKHDWAQVAPPPSQGELLADLTERANQARAELGEPRFDEAPLGETFSVERLANGRIRAEGAVPAQLRMTRKQCEARSPPCGPVTLPAPPAFAPCQVQTSAPAPEWFCADCRVWTRGGPRCGKCGG